MGAGLIVRPPSRLPARHYFMKCSITRSIEHSHRHKLQSFQMLYGSRKMRRGDAKRVAAPFIRQTDRRAKKAVMNPDPLQSGVHTLRMGDGTAEQQIVRQLNRLPIPQYARLLKGCKKEGCRSSPLACSYFAFIFQRGKSAPPHEPPSPHRFR